MMPTIIADDRAVHGGSPKSERHYDTEMTWMWFSKIAPSLFQFHSAKLYSKGTSVKSYTTDDDDVVVSFVGGDGYTYRVMPYDHVYVDYNIKTLEEHAAAVQAHLEYLKRYIAGDIVLAYA